MTVLLRVLIVADCIGFGFLVDRAARAREARQTRPLDALHRAVIKANEFRWDRERI